MYSTCITVYVNADKTKEFIDFTSETRKQTIENEPNCLWFDLMQSSTDETVFLFYEAYKTEADFRAHLSQPYTKLWLEKARKIVYGKEFELNSYNRAFVD